ncbi:CHC2 zinc finger domain-containing protein [uncultured Sphingomonas sp.]|uniref:CHC2 zinc finger domain-containing protein n=1 Tax=uncultured Sphingomonas sp. TaxID=158754 RepID=UPI0025DBC32A|nr:CHC2 zinc finger domain-containing protein [uncultured Sphingomonas sp.]
MNAYSYEQAAAFRRIVDEAKDKHNISDVVARRAKVTKAGREKVSLCLFHQERTPSLRLNDAKGTYHCFGCGASGDIVSLVMHAERLDFRRAVEWLAGANLPWVDPAERVKAAQEEEAERQAAMQRAQAVWYSAALCDETPAEIYARSRGITMPLPPSFRFGMIAAERNGPAVPALLAAVAIEGEPYPVGLQRIFLQPDGSGKADMKSPKMSLGRIKGGAVRVTCRSKETPHEVIVTEGPEDALSLAQELPGREVWACLGTALMIEAQYPARIRSIVIAAQNDEPGRAAADKAAEGLRTRGFDVRIMYPADGYKDWNDQLRGIQS